VDLITLRADGAGLVLVPAARARSDQERGSARGCRWSNEIVCPERA